jgi:hypothetical protein
VQIDLASSPYRREKPQPHFVLSAVLEEGRIPSIPSWVASESRKRSSDRTQMKRAPIVKMQVTPTLAGPGVAGCTRAEPSLA